MPRVIEVTLARDVVAPLVECIRRDADTLQVATPEQPRESGMTPSDLDDVRTLVDLFPPDFPRTPKIRITVHDVAPVVRACALLRLRLRRHELAAITDERLQAAKEPQDLADADSGAWMQYLFLGTIAQLALERFDLAAPSGGWLPKIGTWWTRGRQPRQNAAEPPLKGDQPMWQVVVTNDPVNLMSYVTAVLRTVFGFSQDFATLRMREVHEQQRSIVWTGPRDRAETYARTLKTWHLNAVLAEPSEATAATLKAEG